MTPLDLPPEARATLYALASRLVLAELVGLALLAGGLGLIIGYGVAAALLPDVAASLRGLYGAEIDGTLAVRPIWFASGLAMAVLGALALRRRRTQA